MKASENIKRYREKNNYSMKELSKKSGVSYKTLWKIEHGDVEDITLPTAIKIKKALGITLDQLYEEEKE